jgi:hypothetical protein
MSPLSCITISSSWQTEKSIGPSSRGAYVNGSVSLEMCAGLQLHVTFDLFNTSKYARALQRERKTVK